MRQNTAAFQLLLQDRPVLLEWVPDGGRRVRRRGRLLGDGAVEAPVRVRLATGGERPGAGTTVRVLVPVGHTRWCFSTSVRPHARDEADVVVAWPGAVAQEAGRRHDRVTHFLPVDVRCELTTRPLCTYTLDLSVGGLQLVHALALPVGAPVHLELRVGHARLPASGTVSWTAPLHRPPGDSLYRVGVAFTDVSGSAILRLRELTRGR